VAIEAENWLQHKRYNFLDLLNAARTLLREQAPTCEKIEDVLRQIYWSITYLSEAKKKYEIFHSQFVQLTDKAQQHFTAIGPLCRAL
jgi:hypothetical protein